MFLLTLWRTKMSSVAVSTVLPLAVGLEADVEGAPSELVGSMSRLGRGPSSSKAFSALILPRTMQHNEGRLIEAVVYFR